MKKFIRTLTLAAAVAALGIGSFTGVAWADPELDNNIEIPGIEQLQEIVKTENTQTKKKDNKNSSEIDFNYSGKIDDRTGKPVSGDGYTDGKSYHILKSGELAYNSEESRYYILCGNRCQYCCRRDLVVSASAADDCKNSQKLCNRHGGSRYISQCGGTEGFPCTPLFIVC